MKHARSYSMVIEYWDRLVEKVCPECHRGLHEAMTLLRWAVITPQGVIKLTHADYRCPDAQCSEHQWADRSVEAEALALPHMPYGVDIFLLVGQLRLREQLTVDEFYGSLTGALSVWLVGKVNIWNWSIGIANSAFYVIVFFTVVRYAEMVLQIVFIFLDFSSWYWWLRGRNNRGGLPITCSGSLAALILLFLLSAGTYAEMVFLERFHDSALFWDVFTIALSPIALYLPTHKLQENWCVWMSSDDIYIALYIYNNLYLTAILNVIFLLMCLASIR